MRNSPLRQTDLKRALPLRTSELSNGSSHKKSESWLPSTKRRQQEYGSGQPSFSDTPRYRSVDRPKSSHEHRGLCNSQCLVQPGCTHLFLKHSLLPTSYKPTRKNASHGPHGGSFEPFTLFQISRYGWWYSHSGGEHGRSSQIFVRHYSLQLPYVRVWRRYGRPASPYCGRKSYEGLRIRPERRRSIQRLALFPRRNRSGSWHER